MRVSKIWFPGEPALTFDLESSPLTLWEECIWNVLCVCRWWQGHGRVNHIGNVLESPGKLLQSDKCSLTCMGSSHQGTTAWAAADSLKLRAASNSLSEAWWGQDQGKWDELAPRGWSTGWGGSPGPGTVGARCCCSNSVLVSLVLYWWKTSWSLF